MNVALGLLVVLDFGGLLDFATLNSECGFRIAHGLGFWWIVGFRNSEQWMRLLNVDDSLGLLVVLDFCGLLDFSTLNSG